jgi:hypothetical protein
MKLRDGSIQSANLPAFNRLAKNRVDRDFGLYRCMITRTFFVDDPNNTTFENQQVTYEAVILGGAKEGTILQNVKAMSEYGGEYNYSEKIYRPISTKNLEDKPISQQDGDIVFIQFLQGNTRAPVIVGAGVQPQDLDFTGSTIADGYVSQSQYNGVYELIDKNGNYLLQIKGGALDSASGVFVPDQMGNLASLKMMQQQLLMQTQSGAQINVSGSTIAIGNKQAELFDQLSKALGKLITFFNSVDSAHTHTGNLGYPTSPPTQASQFTQLGSDLQAIQTLINGIKGTLE